MKKKLWCILIVVAVLIVTIVVCCSIAVKEANKDGLIELPCFYGEFGTEIDRVIPYALGAYENGKLARLEYMEDMSDFYEHLFPPEILAPVPNRIRVAGLSSIWKKHLGSDNHADVESLHYWSVPEYASLLSKYPSVTFPDGFDKPLLLIHNKFTTEWDDAPVNFIPIDVVRELHDHFTNAFDVVIIHPQSASNLKGYSQDKQNAPDTELELFDYTGMCTIQDIMKLNPHLTYNQLQMILHMLSQHFVSVQGGTSRLASLFDGSNVVLHVKGAEVEHDEYDLLLSRLSDVKLHVVDSPSKLLLRSKEVMDTNPLDITCVLTATETKDSGVVEMAVRRLKAVTRNAIVVILSEKDGRIWDSPPSRVTEVFSPSVDQESVKAWIQRQGGGVFFVSEPSDPIASVHLLTFGLQCMSIDPSIESIGFGVTEKTPVNVNREHPNITHDKYSISESIEGHKYGPILYRKRFEPTHWTLQVDHNCREKTVQTESTNRVLLFVPLSRKKDLEKSLWSKNLAALDGTDVEALFCIYDTPEKEGCPHLSSLQYIPSHFRYTPGCKAELWWRHIRPSIARKYDYVWLCDEDIDLTDFDYDRFRQICIETGALVIQPSVKGFKGGRSTDVAVLRHIENTRVEYKFVERTEVQCCWIHSPIWDVVHSRLSSMNRQSVWGIDRVWDEAARRLGNPPLLAYIPVLHMDYRSMNSTPKCKRRCIDGCHELIPKELKIIETMRKRIQQKK